MVKLTVDLIQMAQQRVNPVRDRELVLRSFKIPLLENLGATLNQFDTLDFSDNEIRKVDGFPLLPRLKCIIINNNRVVRIGTELHETVPNLETIILTNNCLQELADLQPLSRLEHLQYLSLLGNPVVTRPHYRLFVIHLLPSLRVLDFRRVRLAEKQRAAKLFSTKQKQQKPQAVSTFVPGEKPRGAVPQEEESESTRATAEQTRLLKQAIARATSLQEIEHLHQVLRSGVVPDAQLLKKLAIGQD